MNASPSNVLQPIDPLDISFSQQKCVKTPQTHQTQRKMITSYSKDIIRNPRNMFDDKQNKNHSNRSFTPKVSKFQTVYKPAYRLPDIQLKGWSQRPQKRRLLKTISVFNEINHIKQLDKLDFLIKRVNERIQISKCLYRK